MNLIARLNEDGTLAEQVDDAPELEASIGYLLNIFGSLMPPVNRTTAKMLHVLHYYEFVDNNGFVLSTNQPRLNAPRIYIHWCHDFGGYLEDFDQHVKNAIVVHGGVLADLLMTSTFDHSGARPASTIPVTYITETGEVQRSEGHTVFLTGWDVNEATGNIEYKYQN